MYSHYRKSSRLILNFRPIHTGFFYPLLENRLTFSAFAKYNAFDLSLPLEWKNEKQNKNEQDYKKND